LLEGVTSTLEIDVCNVVVLCVGADGDNVLMKDVLRLNFRLD